jgi:hypothetical protein
MDLIFNALTATIGGGPGTSTLDAAPLGIAALPS